MPLIKSMYAGKIIFISVFTTNSAVLLEQLLELLVIWLLLKK